MLHCGFLVIYLLFCYFIFKIGPRFAEPNTFQFTYGQRWKQLLELFKQKKDAIEREFKMEEDKLISQMEYAKFEHETEMLRERNCFLQLFDFVNTYFPKNILFVELRQREQDRERQKRDWEIKERQREESRIREEECLRRQQDDIQHRLRQQEDDMRRRQQETVFLQEQSAELNSSESFRRPLQPPPIFDFDRPMASGINGPQLLVSRFQLICTAS